VARNVALNLLGDGLPLVVAFICIPVVVRLLGAPRFGVLSLAWIVLSYFGVFDLGLGRAATRFAAEALSRGNTDAVPHIAQTAILMQGLLGVAGAVVLVALAPVLVSHVLKIPPDLVSETRLALYELAAAVPVVLVSGSLRGVLEAARRFDVVNAIKLPANSANFLLPLLGAALGWHLPGIVALLVAGRAITMLALFAACVRQFPAVLHPARIERARARSLLTFGGWVTVSSVVSPILVYIDRVAVGALLSMAAVTYYTAPYEMVTRLWIIPTSLVAALFPIFSGFADRLDAMAVERLVLRSLKLLLLSVGPIVILVYTFAPDVLRLWLGREFSEQGTVALRILAIGVLVNSLAQVPYSLIQGLGRPDLTAKFHLMELPLQVLLAWACVDLWGIAGAALAWSARIAVDAALLFAAASRLAPLNRQTFRASRLSRAAALVLLFGLPMLLAGSALGSLSLRVTAAIAILAIQGVVTWRYALDQEDRSRVLKLVAVSRDR
jgi:O-antigen/teichoic acid export membrane protein